MNIGDHIHFSSIKGKNILHSNQSTTVLNENLNNNYVQENFILNDNIKNKIPLR